MPTPSSSRPSIRPPSPPATGPTAAYQAARTGARTQRELLAAYVLPAEVWPELRDHAIRAWPGLLVDAVRPREPRPASATLGVPAVKLGSGELTNRTLLAGGGGTTACRCCCPPGWERARRSSARSVWLRSAGADQIALFHCVSSYPAPLEQANLRAIPTMRADFGVPVGWSDHTIGWCRAVAAVALGASLVEKHLTLDTGRDGPDHAASADPADVHRLRRVGPRGLREPWATGSSDRPRPSWSTCPSCVARGTRSATCRPGRCSHDSDLVALRPEAGSARPSTWSEPSSSATSRRSSAISLRQTWPSAGPTGDDPIVVVWVGTRADLFPLGPVIEALGRAAGHLQRPWSPARPSAI